MQYRHQIIFFLRYIDPNFKQNNIEATGGGGYSSDEDYIKDFQISAKGIRSGTYLKTMSHREFIAELVADVAIYWGMQGDNKRCIRYLERCVKIRPNSAEINDALGRAYLTYSKSLKGVEAETYWNKGWSYKDKAKELGLVRPSTEEYLKTVKKKAKEEASSSKGGK